MKKGILMIDKDGSLKTWDGRRWLLTSRAWRWEDIASGFKRLSKRNWKAYQAAQNKQSTT